MKQFLFAVASYGIWAASAEADPGQLLFTLMPDVPVAAQDFADALSIHGNYVLVGAEDTMQDGVPSVGAAYLFEAATGNQLRKIMLSDPPQTRAFGTSVALDGERMVIGAADENGVQGAAYVFDIDGNQLFKLLPAVGGAMLEFGDTVAISGNYVVTSAPGGFGPKGSGLAYLFDLTDAIPGSTLTAAPLTQPADLPTFPEFATSLDIDGERIVIGIDRNGLGGAAYVYDIAGNLLRRLATPLLPGTSTPAPGFGRTVAISGNIAIVGATLDDNQVLNEVGRAYLFDVETGALLFELLPSTSQPADLFSDTLAIDGNLAIVSQRLEAATGIPNIVNTGFLFDVSTGQELLKFPGAGIMPGMESFEAVAIDGGRAVVGLEGIGQALLFDVLVGDYNHNGVVDAADYTEWRNTLHGSVDEFAGADGNGDEMIDEADYLLWKANYGVAGPQPIMPGGGAAAGLAGVPEPASCWVLLGGVVCISIASYRSRRQRDAASGNSL
jgi:hypothetical protein